MENQPRPWFRQPTQSRIDPTPTTTPTPQPGPTPLLRRSSFLFASSLVPPANQPQQSQPQPQPSPANQRLQSQRQPSPEPPVPTRSPPIQPSPAAQLPPPTRLIAAPLTSTPPQSPRIIRPSNPTPPPSPKANQMESSANSVIMQEEAKGRPTPPPTKSEDHKHAAALFGRGYNNAKPKDESETSLITIAGENMGSYMDLGFPPGYPQHGRKLQQAIEASVRDEGKSGEKDKVKPKQQKPTAALVNSNVQSVNNSILFNTSCITRSPGVHVTLATRHAPRGEPALPSKSMKEALPESHGH